MIGDILSWFFSTMLPVELVGLGIVAVGFYLGWHAAILHVAAHGLPDDVWCPREPGYDDADREERCYELLLPEMAEGTLVVIGSDENEAQFTAEQLRAFRRYRKRDKKWRR